jgi:programmed cell death protein 5
MPETGLSPEEAQLAEQMKKAAMRKILSRGALDRLARVKLVRPEIAAQLELYLMNLYKSGKIKSEVSEEQMKMILETISGTQKSGNIKIMRK